MNICISVSLYIYSYIWQYAINGCNLPAEVVESSKAGWGSPKQNKSQIRLPLESVQIHNRRWSCANRHSDEPGRTGVEGSARLNRTELNRTDSPSRTEPNRIQTHRTHRARRAHRAGLTKLTGPTGLTGLTRVVAGLWHALATGHGSMPAVPHLKHSLPSTRDALF